jgi:hypothetical protein
MSYRSGLFVAALALLALGSGCASRPPTVAHVHIGHAITGVHVTPGEQGYMEVAQTRAGEAIDAAAKAQGATDLVELKSDIQQANDITNGVDNFGVKESITMAVRHVSFAATSDDATQNVRDAAPVFATDSDAVVQRCTLIELLAKDVASSANVHDAQISVAEIVKLTRANLNGAESGGGKPGATPADYGIHQLRAELEAMIARERPKYVTVDQWYLFNLVRLPNGRWVFDKFGRGGNIEGYK